MGFFKKIKIVFIVLLLLVVAVAFIVCNRLGIGLKDIFNYKDITYSTTPYAMKTEYQQIIENATERVDLYVSRSNGYSKYKAIYSFDIRAGVDLKKCPPTVTNDTVFLPYPTITSVDQTDGDKPLVLMERGNIDIISAKIAMEMIAKDYAYRSDIVERSAELLKQYFQKMDTKHIYKIKDDSRKSNRGEETFEIPIVGLRFSYFPELLRHKYRCKVCVDSFSRNFITFIDNTTNCEIFSVCYKADTRDIYDETRKQCNYSDNLEIRDPVYPDEKVVIVECSDGNATIQFGRDVFCSKTNVYGEDAKSYLPDIIYLLSTLHVSENHEFSENYHTWINNYDRCIQNINKQSFGNAKDDLDIMKSVCANECEDVKFLRDLVNALGGYSLDSYVSDNLRFCITLRGLYDIKDGADVLDEEQYRRQLLEQISINDDTEHFKQQLERYYLRELNLSPNEAHNYKMNLIETGEGVDKELVKSFKNKEFLEFIKNALYNAIRQIENTNYSNLEIENRYKRSEINNNIVLIKVKPKAHNDVYGAPNVILDKLKKNGLIIKDNEPLFIVVFQQDHSVFNTGRWGDKTLDQDALVYARDGIWFFANYNGVFSKDDRFIKYEDVSIKDEENGVIDMPIYLSKYDVHAPIACKLLKTIQEAYKKDYPDDMKNEIIKKMQNKIVSMAKDNIYWVQEPINVDMR